MRVRLYTDGLCIPNPGQGTWAFVVLDESDNVLTERFGYERNTTNNRMEFKALIEGLNYCDDAWNIEAHSDSMLLVNSVNVWMEKWERKKFKGRANVDLLRELSELKKKKKLDLHWIKGHNGHVWNERADHLTNVSYEMNREDIVYDHPTDFV